MAGVFPEDGDVDVFGEHFNWLPGNGSGGFAEEASGSPFAVGVAPQIVVVGDFNGDGIQDLATSNQLDDLTVLLGFITGHTAQTITFGALSNVTNGVSPFTISATASSSLAVSFASTTFSVCTVTGTTITILYGGTCSIIASQAGNATYASATSVTQSFTVNPEPQTNTFGPLGAASLGVSSFDVSATASSGLQASFASTTPAVCTIAGSTVTIVAVGTCSITATQTGDSGYLAATPVTQNFMVIAATTT